MTVNSQSGPAEDLISTATSALRRLHFKTGRVSSGKTAAAPGTGAPAKQQQQQQVVPKVVVMGSSTASTETNINTSTDSSNTITTTMTVTDGECEDDSPDERRQPAAATASAAASDPLIMNSENVFADSGGGGRPLTPATAVERPPRSPRFQADMFTYEEGHIARYRMMTPSAPPPGLRVDFFSEPSPERPADGSVCLNRCLREAGLCEDLAAAPTDATADPPADGVAQPPHRRQLLDVGAAAGLTHEEMHDFEMRYGSPHHSRSQSVKTPGRAGGGRPNYLCLPQQRSRVASMPNTGVEEEYYRLRHFSITGKGVVNRGDSLKSRRSRSSASVASSGSSTEHLPAAAAVVAGCGSARTSATCSLASSRESSTSNPGPVPHRVLMLGGPAVGKSSLVSQFMTSEYLHAYDTSLDDESGEKSVSVLLAGEESELTFIDHPCAEMTPERCVSRYADLQAYCVVYSSSDRASLAAAEAVLRTLWTSDTVSTKAVILVANKADLVRSRVVTTEEGKSVATSYDCKYIETSVGINHNVDELLVGVLTQIRLKLENPERTRDIFRKRSSSRKGAGAGAPRRGSGQAATAASAAPSPAGSPAHQTPAKKYRGSRTSASLKVRGLLGRVWARDSKSKSCENLHVL